MLYFNSEEMFLRNEQQLYDEFVQQTGCAEHFLYCVFF